jgi:hypothetical protein
MSISTDRLTNAETTRVDSHKRSRDQELFDQSPLAKSQKKVETAATGMFVFTPPPAGPSGTTSSN